MMSVPMRSWAAKVGTSKRFFGVFLAAMEHDADALFFIKKTFEGCAVWGGRYPIQNKEWAHWVILMAWGVVKDAIYRLSLN